MTNRSAMRVLMILTPLFGMTGAFGADPPPVEKSRDVNAQRLKFMKESVEAYELSRKGDTAAVLKLQPDPAFRLGKQGDGVVLEGAIFLWADEVGRPGAAAQVFLVQRRRGPVASGGTSSLRSRPARSQRYKGASRAGCRWCPAYCSSRSRAPRSRPTSPPHGSARCATWPPSSAPRTISGAGDGMPSACCRPDQPIRQSRRHAQGRPLFAFVLGTDPESFLFIEARPGAKGLEWQYAFAPMTCWALKAEHKGRSVWSLPSRTFTTPVQTFYSRVYTP